MILRKEGGDEKQKIFRYGWMLALSKGIGMEMVGWLGWLVCNRQSGNMGINGVGTRTCTLSLLQLQCNNAFPALAFFFFLLFLILSISLTPNLFLSVYPFFNLFLSQQILPLLKKGLCHKMDIFFKAPKIKQILFICAMFFKVFEQLTV